MEQLSGLLARRRAAAARGSGSAQARPRTSSSRGGSGGAAPTAVGVVAVVAGLVGLSLLVETLTAPDSTLGPAAVELFAKLDEACERRGLLGVVYFSAAYVVATLLLAPASMLVILAGAIYGPALGSAVAVVATIVGSGAAFLVARYLARPSVARRMNAYPRFAAVDRAVAMEGGRMVLLMRLSPFIPFNVANYMFGLTAVELWPYLGFTLLGMLPYTFIFVYMGAATRATMMAIQGGHAHADDAEPAPAWQSPAKISLYVIGVAATAMITYRVSLAASQTLNEYTGEEGDDSERELRRTGTDDSSSSSGGGHNERAPADDSIERGEAPPLDIDSYSTRQEERPLV